jgi:nitrite reductase/ring-hydroxylating ferredoxin subunit
MEEAEVSAPDDLNRPLENERLLCALDDIADGGSRGFPAAPGGFIGLFAVRRGEAVFVYVNSCPHVGVPLEMQPHQFLDEAGERIICAAHGATFRVEDGLCMAGPCEGEGLETVPVRMEAGQLFVPAKAGL